MTAQEAIAGYLKYSGNKTIDIRAALIRAGLEPLAVFDADKDLDTPDSLSPVTETTERMLFVARKPLA